MRKPAEKVEERLRCALKPEQICSHPGMQVGRDLQVAGNNRLKAPLNTSARGEHSSASAENSDGIDPDYCCRVAVVRWRRILGPAARPLVNDDRLSEP